LQSDPSKKLRECRIKRFRYGGDSIFAPQLELDNFLLFFYGPFDLPVDNNVSELSNYCNRTNAFNDYGGGGPSPWSGNYNLITLLDGSRDKLKMKVMVATTPFEEPTIDYYIAERLK
jgi:hypothetical protein